MQVHPQAKESPQVKLPRIWQIFEGQRALEAKAGGLLQYITNNIMHCNNLHFFALLSL